jgi:formylglycine-generating enzyme required for sulfatase activity
MAFCRWLSTEAGDEFTLPSEAEWEYACRAGASTAMFYGDLDADFSAYANMADATLTKFASNPYTVDEPLQNPTKYDDWIPKDARFDDGTLLTARPGTYRPNPWGLADMHGNVAEWTRTTYRPSLAESIAAEAADAPGRKVVRGGSCRDRPYRCTSSFRLGYLPHQRVYNVGFRIVAKAKTVAVASNSLGAVKQ